MWPDHECTLADFLQVFFSCLFGMSLRSAGWKKKNRKHWTAIFDYFLCFTVHIHCLYQKFCILPVFFPWTPGKCSHVWTFRLVCHSVKLNRFRLWDFLPNDDLGWNMGQILIKRCCRSSSLFCSCKQVWCFVYVLLPLPQALPASPSTQQNWMWFQNTRKHNIDNMFC